MSICHKESKIKADYCAKTLVKAIDNVLQETQGQPFPFWKFMNRLFSKSLLTKNLVCNYLIQSSASASES